MHEEWTGKMDEPRVVEITRLKVLVLSRKRVKAIDSLRQQLKPTKTPVTHWHLIWMLMFSTTQLFAATVQRGRSSEIVGVALLISNKVLGGRRDSLEELVVELPHQGKGIGGQLVDAVVEESRAKGAELIDLTVANDNPEAQNLYKRRGFKPLDDRQTQRLVHEPLPR